MVLRASDNASSQIFINGTDNTGGDAGSATTANMSFDGDINIGGKDAASSELSGSRYFAGVIDEIALNRGVLGDAAIEDLAAQANYTRTSLGTLTGEPSLTHGMNASDQAAGYDEDASDGSESAWFWENDSFTSLGTLGGATSAALDINASGTVVGRADTADGDTHAFSWDSVGGMQDLGVLAGRTDSEAYGVNGDDEVVGTSLNLGPPATGRLAFLYLPSDAYGLSAGMNSLGTLGGGSSVAMDINDSGQVVGGAQNSSGDMRPFLWLPSAAYGLSAGMNDLGTLGGDSRRVSHRAEAINGSGQVVGMSYTAGGERHAFLWLPSAAYGLLAGMNDLGTLSGGDISWAFDIDDSGSVVGTSNMTGGDFHAFVWEDGTLSDLNDSIEINSGWELVRATAISPNGDVAGWGTNPSSQTRAVNLAPASCGCGGARRMSTLGHGSGFVDASGTFEAEITDDEGEPVAQILVVDANPGETFEFEVIEPARDSAVAPEPGTGMPTDPASGLASDRTLTVRALAPAGSFKLVVTMIFSAGEMAELGAVPKTLELHVLDSAPGSPPGVWVPAGTCVGESAPTGIVGDSGYFFNGDGGVEFWAVRDRAGTFAVGVGAGHAEETGNQSIPRPAFLPALCGAGAVQLALVGLVAMVGVRVRRRLSGHRRDQHLGGDRVSLPRPHAPPIAARSPGRK